MDGQNSKDLLSPELILQLLALLSVVVAVIGTLVGYIWHRHTKEVDSQKKAIAELAEKKAEGQSVERVRQDLALSQQQMGQSIKEKVEAMRDEYRRENDRLVRQHQSEIEALRRDINGMGERMMVAMGTMRSDIGSQIDQQGQSMVAQVALLVKLVETIQKQNGNSNGG